MTYPGDTGKYECEEIEQLKFLSVSGLESFEPVKIKMNIDKEKNVFAKNNIYDGTCELGQLTRKGNKQLAELGDKMNKVYSGKFISSTFNVNEVTARSTSVTRVIQSAESFLQHFFPASTRKPSDKIRIQTIPSEINIQFLIVYVLNLMN